MKIAIDTTHPKTQSPLPETLRPNPWWQRAVTALMFFGCWLIFAFVLLPIMSDDDRKRLRVPESLDQVFPLWVS